MRLTSPPTDAPLDPEWRRPLIDAAVAVSNLEHWSDQFFDPNDFMIMGRLERRSRPSILLYKHADTRRYLNLDDTGLAYRYCSPKDITKGSGRYVRRPDFRAAIDSLGLWELPWMRPDLESFRHGFSWEDRWKLLDLDLGPELPIAGTSIEGGRDRGHLRLV